MSEQTFYKTKDMLQKDLEKFFKVKLTNEEFEVIRDFAISDHDAVYGDDYRFHPYEIYICSIKQWGTKSGKIRKEAEDPEFFYPSPFKDKSVDRIFNFTVENTRKVYVSIQNEVDNRYQSLDKKRENIRKENKQSLKEYKKSSPSSWLPDPDIFIGLVVLIFLTWLIFGGGDLSPGGPKFFGHDGG